MKNAPEIAPEVRGLIEEIVANPRSSLRLVPKRALLPWIESGETASARDVSSDVAVRHLLSAHREAVARLLREAAHIAYWKAPVMAVRPVGADGKSYDPSSNEGGWKTRAEMRAHAVQHPDEGVELLRQCLVEIDPGCAHKLAKASLLLSPEDKARCYVAFTLPWSMPRTAIALFARLARRAEPKGLRSWAMLSLAARLCAVNCLHEAREAYRASARLDPDCPIGRFSAFNLSCFLGDEAGAIFEASQFLGTKVDDPTLLEVRDLLSGWALTRGPGELEPARRVARRVHGQVHQSAWVLCGAFAS